jgi:hypothetical protein
LLLRLKHIDKAVRGTLGEVFAAIEAFGVVFEAASWELDIFDHLCQDETTILDTLMRNVCSKIQSFMSKDSKVPVKAQSGET